MMNKCQNSFNNINNFAEVHFRDAIEGYHNSLFETQIKWTENR